MGIFSIFKRSNVLYFPGCVTYFKYKDNYELYQKIFKKLGINYVTISKNVCCGLPALEAGYETVSRKLARRNFEIFKEEGINKIITNSPDAYKMFSQNYPDTLPDWNIEVLNIWDLILQKLIDKPGIIKFRFNETITFQDNCYLAGYMGVYDTPRKILELLGFTIIEMYNNRKKSMCVGSCGGLMITNPELADLVANERLSQAKRTGVKKLIVTSLQNYDLLNKNSNDIEVVEFSDILGIALGLKDVEGLIVNETGALFEGDEEEKIEEIELNLEK